MTIFAPNLCMLHIVGKVLRIHTVNCSNNTDPGEEQIAGDDAERITEESVDGFIESKGTPSTNETSEDKYMEQSGTIDSFDKSSDCSSRKGKPNDLDTGVDGNK
ncbi:hypothetical protein ElyMa_005325100 [Elysia marginata]|uniref:Uncharacterized protein n=1 Tax=Elysia marginata TaxID=1093978 RepID=A0AAV4K574_9GAST|nr:hypothetical protein ElyMa_005325100 [Elysia marginata]